MSSQNTSSMCCATLKNPTNLVYTVDKPTQRAVSVLTVRELVLVVSYYSEKKKTIGKIYFEKHFTHKLEVNFTKETAITNSK